MKAIFKTSIHMSLLALVLLLSGCSPVRQLSPEEYETIRQNKKTIVLFRVTGSLDNKEVHLLGERAALSSLKNAFHDLNLTTPKFFSQQTLLSSI